MADTYTSPATFIPYGVGKSMWSIFNGSGSGKVIRPYRIWTMNNTANQNYVITYAIQGFLTTLGVVRITSSTGGLDVAAVKHDSNNTNLAPEVLVKTGATVQDTTILRTMLISNEDVNAGDSSFDCWSLVIPCATIWEVGYANGNATKPLTLREGEGVSIKHLGAGPSGGWLEIFAEFTQANS